MPPEATIPGGYILLARKMLESELMDKPPHFLKLWIWLLSKAFWKDGDNIKRGQLHTTIAEMQDVGRYLNGGKMVNRLTENQVRSAYGHLVKNQAISVTKTTRGMVISINNFNTYQDPNSYQPRTPNAARTDNGTDHTQKTALVTENIIKNNQKPKNQTRNAAGTDNAGIEKEVKEIKNLCTSPPAKRPPSGDHQLFIQWWCFAYEHTQTKPYIITARDGKSVKALVNHPKLELSHLIAMAAWLLTTDEAFYASDRTLPALERTINKTGITHSYDDYRKAGIIPPEGIKFRDWQFWQQDEQQEALAI
jgi:hypothetical protein